MPHSRRKSTPLLAVALALIAALVVAPATAAASDHPDQLPAGLQSFANPHLVEAARLDPQIVGGRESTFQRHPWLVQMTINGSAFCGGVLIHPMIVMTAAHCLVRDDGQWWANLGQMRLHTSRTMSETGGEELVWTNAWRADDYSATKFSNDYGFISLNSPSARPQLKIAGADERTLWKPGRSAQVAGFGRIVQDGAASPVLKELSVPLLADSFCSSPTVYGSFFDIGNMLCAGIVTGGAGTCQGDSGGPLTVLGDRGVRRIVGVVSWGEGCAKPQKPTVYTRVAEHPVASRIANLVRQIEQTMNFPGINSGVKVIGSGAKPVGCAAATTKATTAATASRSATTRYTSAAKAATKAKKAHAKAKKKLAKAKSGKSRKAAKKAVTKAAKKSKAATTKAKSAKKRATAAKKSATAATAAAKRACA